MKKEEYFKFGKNVFSKVKGKDFWGTQYFMIKGFPPDWLKDVPVEPRFSNVCIDDVLSSLPMKEYKKTLRVTNDQCILKSTSELINITRSAKGSAIIFQPHYSLVKEIYPNAICYHFSDSHPVIFKIKEEVVAIVSQINPDTISWNISGMVNNYGNKTS